MAYSTLITTLLLLGFICVLVMMLLKRRGEVSALREEISNKNVEIAILGKKLEALTQTDAVQQEGGSSSAASRQQVADVEAWADSTREQMQKYIDEVNQYAATLIANAQAEAERIVRDARSAS